jgi:hypothetical protein
MMCPVDTGRAYAESLAWGGDYGRAIEIARGVLAYAEDRMAHGTFTEKHYHVAVARDLLAALLAAPETSPALRDVRGALALAERNVAHFPGDVQFRTALGFAQYRDGRWREAIATLTEADRLPKGRRAAPRGFVLAMAHWRAGQEAEAVRWFRQAAAWMDEQRPGHGELVYARAEAAALLGLADNKVIPELPPDPFAR